MLLRKLCPALILLFVLVSCEKENSEVIKEKEFNLSGFTQVYTGEKIHLVIQQGATYNIKAKGRGADIDKLELELTDDGQTLDIAYNGTPSDKIVDIFVTLPDLEVARLNGNVIATIKGFHEQVGTIGLILSGHANVAAHDGASVFGVEVAGQARLTLHGFTASLAGTVLENGIVSAYGLNTTRVYITTTQNAKAYVKPAHIFYGSASDESKIFYKGDPANTELETSGNGQIIKE